MSQPRLLDLFCCQGGASAGYVRAGFEVTGVDIDPQPRYPYPFHQSDALKFALEHHTEFDAFHASPPCQAHTTAQKLQGNDHPDFVPAVRSLFELIGKPWVIENVVGAPLRDPILLCGSMFDLATYRHRLFEVSFPVPLMMPPCNHAMRTAKLGRRAGDHEAMNIVGHFSDVPRARDVMEMPWASQDGLREAIPPAYTEFIGAQLIEALEVAA